MTFTTVYYCLPCVKHGGGFESEERVDLVEHIEEQHPGERTEIAIGLRAEEEE